VTPNHAGQVMAARLLASSGMAARARRAHIHAGQAAVARLIVLLRRGGVGEEFPNLFGPGGGGAPSLPPPAWWRRQESNNDGDPWMGSADLSMGFPFLLFLFDLLRWAYNRLGKGHIYCDLYSEPVAKTVSVNLFCLPR